MVHNANIICVERRQRRRSNHELSRVGGDKRVSFDEAKFPKFNRGWVAQLEAVDRIQRRPDEKEPESEDSNEQVPAHSREDGRRGALRHLLVPHEHRQVGADGPRRIDVKVSEGCIARQPVDPHRRNVERLRHPEQTGTQREEGQNVHPLAGGFVRHQHFVGPRPNLQGEIRRKPPVVEDGDRERRDQLVAPVRDGLDRRYEGVLRCAGVSVFFPRERAEAQASAVGQCGRVGAPIEQFAYAFDGLSVADEGDGVTGVEEGVRDGEHAGVVREGGCDEGRMDRSLSGSDIFRMDDR
mmetsp:Transcript_39233/g.117987  ORF Transcript_39233/g.117987 Transcript_39233/m.117987 type:complete len:296 (+) Transcript_39233:1017-1904(+)